MSAWRRQRLSMREAKISAINATPRNRRIREYATGRMGKPRITDEIRLDCTNSKDNFPNWKSPRIPSERWRDPYSG
jgi:hypothetical protein